MLINNTYFELASYDDKETALHLVALILGKNWFSIYQDYFRENTFAITNEEYCTHGEMIRRAFRLTKLEYKVYPSPVWPVDEGEPAKCASL